MVKKGKAESFFQISSYFLEGFYKNKCHISTEDERQNFNF